MSLTVSISRRREPLDEDGPAIGPEEWTALAALEPDFRGPLPGEAPGAGPWGKVWVRPQGATVVFDFRDGEIEVANPDPPTIARMKTLASRLGANVFSETGELFDDEGASAGFLDGYP